MDFKIVYYKNSSGESPIEKLLIEMKRTNNPLAEQAIKGIEKLRNRAYHREPLSKYLEQGLWELRIKASNNILRIIYTFTKNQIIILLHVFIKKRQRTPARELEIARNRIKQLKGENEKKKR